MLWKKRRRLPCLHPRRSPLNHHVVPHPRYYFCARLSSGQRFADGRSHGVGYNALVMHEKPENERNPDRRGFLRRALRQLLPWLAGAVAGKASPGRAGEVTAPPAATAATEPMPEAVKRELDAQWEEFSRNNPDYARPLDS